MVTWVPSWEAMTFIGGGGGGAGRDRGRRGRRGSRAGEREGNRRNDRQGKARGGEVWVLGCLRGELADLAAGGKQTADALLAGKHCITGEVAKHRAWGGRGWEERTREMLKHGAGLIISRRIRRARGICEFASYCDWWCSRACFSCRQYHVICSVTLINWCLFQSELSWYGTEQLKEQRTAGFG